LAYWRETAALERDLAEVTLRAAEGNPESATLEASFNVKLCQC